MTWTAIIWFIYYPINFSNLITLAKNRTASLFLLTLGAIDVRILPGAEKGDLGLFAFVVSMLSICYAAKVCIC
jgi:hypothetical protein